MENPILITGASRSGASMIAGTLNICGVFSGTISWNSKNNERGMFENIKIKQNVIDHYFIENGLDPIPESNKGYLFLMLYKYCISGRIALIFPGRAT